MKAMVVKEFRELLRDRRTLAMLIVLPLLLLVVFGYAADFSISSAPTAVVGPQAEQVASQLPSFFDVTITPSTSGSRSMSAIPFSGPRMKTPVERPSATTGLAATIVTLLLSRAGSPVTGSRM